MDDLRIVVIVSNDRSDLYFANQLIQRLNVVGAIVENQQYTTDSTPIVVKALKLAHKPHILLAKALNLLNEKLIRRHAPYNQPRNKTDFGEQGRELFPNRDCTVLYTPGVKDINHADNIEWLKRIRPDVIAVCGASILKNKILSIPEMGVLNLHGGLSQQYRGLFTTDWAIYNEQPEYVGATVHYVSSGIDDGDIIYQGRPEITPDDNPNSLYVKVVKLGVDMMELAIKDIQNDSIHAAPLPVKGKLYLASMYTPRRRDQTWRKLRKGVITRYLKDKEVRDEMVLGQLINNYHDIRRLS
jgi:methionyl-tRNA formyltransferase